MIRVKHLPDPLQRMQELQDVINAADEARKERDALIRSSRIGCRELARQLGISAAHISRMRSA